MEQEHQFIDYIEQSIIKNWDKDALTDYKGITLQYKDVARKIAKFHIVLESAGIQPGDKIAVCGRNSAHWAVTFLATITYGAESYRLHAARALESFGFGQTCTVITPRNIERGTARTVPVQYKRILLPTQGSLCHSRCRYTHGGRSVVLRTGRPSVRDIGKDQELGFYGVESFVLDYLISK